MAASPPPTNQVPSVDPHAHDESDPQLETKQQLQDSASVNGSDAKPETEQPQISPDPSPDPLAAAEDEVESGEKHVGEDGNLTFHDLRAVVDEMDENLDDAFGQAADTLWNFATSVTGKVSSVVKDQHGLETLRKNVTSRLPPLSNISRDIQTQIGTLAPNEDSIASIAGSVKSVAETVQRNAVAMEEAILARANDVGDSNAATSIVDASADLTAGDPGVAILPEMQRADGLDEIARVGESVSNVLGETVGGLWSGLWGTGDDEAEDLQQKQAAKMPKTRFGKRIFELQANPNTYCEPAKDLDAFAEWGRDFNLDNYEQECMELLYTHDSIAELYERVVPRVVEENLFWMRYFFAKHSLAMEEERRQKLLERAENAVEGADDEDAGWGDDDWGDQSLDEADGDTQRRESLAEGSSHDADKVQASAAASETPSPQSDGESKQKQSNAISGTENASTKKDNVINGTKEKASNNGEEPTAQVEVQDGGDDWGDDDWE